MNDRATTSTVSRHKQSAVFSCVCDVSLTSIYDANVSETDDDDDDVATVNDACDTLAALALAMASLMTSHQRSRQSEGRVKKAQWKKPPRQLLRVLWIAIEIG